MNTSPVSAYIGLGANIGDALGNVQRAIGRLAQLPQTCLSAQSSLFRSAPIKADGDDYINAVARIDTQLSAPQLLQKLQAIEQEFGRERPYPNAPRTLDLDMLLYGEHCILSESLIVPHPSLTERAFALIPLLQIDPLITIPGKGPAHLFVQHVVDQPIAKIDTRTCNALR